MFLHKVHHSLLAFRNMRQHFSTILGAILNREINKEQKCKIQRDLQDGRGIRCGDHLPSYKYIKNTSTCGTTPTEHLLKAGRRPQTSKKARNSPHTWVGQKKKRDKRVGMGPAPIPGRDLGGSGEGGKVSTNWEAPSLVGQQGGSFGTTKESAATGV